MVGVRARTRNPRSASAILTRSNASKDADACYRLRDTKCGGLRFDRSLWTTSTTRFWKRSRSYSHGEDVTEADEDGWDADFQGRDRARFRGGVAACSCASRPFEVRPHSGDHVRRRQILDVSSVIDRVESIATRSAHRIAQILETGFDRNQQRRSVLAVDDFGCAARLHCVARANRSRALAGRTFLH